MKKIPRSTHRVFYEKCVLKNFIKCAGKPLCLSLFFNKAAGLVKAKLKKESPTLVFPCEFRENFNNSFIYRIALVTV